MIPLLKLRPYSGDIAPPSPNHGARKAQVIEGIVLHATEDAANEARSLSWLRSPESRTSYHLLVTRDGRVIRLVGDQQRAWHAGLSSWRGKRDVNSITLGIAIANRNDGEPYTAAQYRRVSEIVAHYCRQGLSLDDVISHAEIAPGRRTDPLGWDWHRLRAMVKHQLQPMDLPLSGIAPRAASGAGVRGAGAGARRDRAGAAGAGAGAAGDGAGAAGAGAGPAGEGAGSTMGFGTAPTAAFGAAPATAVPTTPPPATPPFAPPTAPTAMQRVPAIFRAKPMVRSRTLWLNGLMVLAAAGAILVDTLHLAPVLGLELSDRITIWVLIGVAVVNIVLRFSTTQPLCATAARSSSRRMGPSMTEQDRS